MPADLQRARDLFLHAVGKLPSEQWEGYLAEACSGDLELQRQVCHLLQVHREAGSFLESPAANFVATLDEPINEAPGTIIGPYKLLEQIGEGGFGVVFMAEQQQPIRRKVALKVLKPGMDTRQVIARFEAERQALALMDHPNIAHVFDGGETASGRPYFVMELVKGVPITDYCDQSQLTPKDRLELFIPVCQAVQHAHQKGIIHRDIKPSNVMVTLHDGTPVPKIIDFGIAKATGQQLTDKTLFTNFAQLIGTPLYMSPEQAALSGLDVDTRSDIYSLGVLLYELLTGTTPFDKERLKTADFDEIRRIIREEEPPKPSTRMSTVGQAATTASEKRRSDPRKLSRLFRGELDWIVMKALEKDRNRRYETASAFAADVKSYLHDEQVAACPPSAWYRFRKFARRNKSGLAIAGLILFFLVFLGAGLGWVMRDRAARRDEGERRAEVALQQAGRLLEEERWSEALSFVGQAEAVLGSSGGGEDLLGQASRLRQDLETAQGLEDARLKMTGARDGQYDWQASDAAYAEAFEKYQLDVDGLDAQEAAHRLRASPICRQLTAALDDWAYVRKVNSTEGWQRRLALARAADPDRWRNRLRDALERKDDGALEEVIESASPDDWPAATLVLLGRLARATPSAERAAALLRRAQQKHPSDFWINVELGRKPPRHPEDQVHYYGIAVALRPQSAWAHNDLALALRAQGRLEEATAEYRKAIDLVPKEAVLHCNLGIILVVQGKWDEGVAEYHKAIDLVPKTAKAHTELGTALIWWGKADEGIAECKKALAIDPNCALAHSSLGIGYQCQGKPDEARAEHKKALAIDPKSAYHHSDFAWTLNKQGKFDEAIAEFKKALGIDPNLGSAHLGLGAILNDRKGDYDGAVAAYREAIRLNWELEKAHGNLGNVLRKQGKFDEAIAEYHKAIDIDPRLVSAHNGLAWLLATCPDPKLREPGRAIQLAKHAVGLSPKDGNNWNTLGVAHYRAGNWKEALAALKRSMELRSGGDAFDWFFLAMAHWQLADKQEARTWFDQAIQWMEKNQPENEELRRFRAEGTELLKIQDKKNYHKDTKDTKKKSPN